MSAIEDVKYQLGQMRRRPGDSDEKFAIRLFSMQIEVYSANAGRDLDTETGSTTSPQKTAQTGLLMQRIMPKNMDIRNSSLSPADNEIKSAAH